MQDLSLGIQVYEEQALQSLILPTSRYLDRKGSAGCQTAEVEFLGCHGDRSGKSYGGFSRSGVLNFGVSTNEGHHVLVSQAKNPDFWKYLGGAS